MKRRLFIERSTLGYLGLALSPGILGSCREEELLLDVNFSGKVIIIGAGAAGLYAGLMLISKGIDFTILEAANKSGGRVGKKADFADFPIDLGAQWLHGRNSILGDLAKETKTAFTIDNSETVFWYNNKITGTLPKDVEGIMTPNMNASDISYADYAEANGLGDDYKLLVEQLAGDLGADSSDISIKWTAIEEDEWNAGDDDFKFQESFSDLIEKNITDKVKDSIQLNTPIEKIDYSSDQINITDQSGNTYNADKVIITVPITILQDGDIEFIPALPTAKTDAFNKIGMGAGMKVFLKFSYKFFDENIAGGSICAAYADDSVGKKGADNVLLAFVMGKQAEYLTSLGSDAAIVNALLGELDTMYDGQATATYQDAHVENWTTNPYVKGAYSYSKVGIGNARSIAAEPIANKLFFAGEAMNINGNHQTVHGAVETGYREVINILKSVKK